MANIKPHTVFQIRSYLGGIHPQKIQHGLLHMSTKFHALITKWTFLRLDRCTIKIPILSGLSKRRNRNMYTNQAA